ncbi:MAG: M23 family metallopeptidase [Magnetococcales bacterium]|nr:M23 family metallopeptidase [Magnetococcales bacterium]
MPTILLLAAPSHATPTLQAPAKLDPGTAAIIHITDAIPGSSFQGWLNDTPFPITPDGAAIIALDMEVEPGVAHLRVETTSPHGERAGLVKKLSVMRRPYKEERLTLPKKKVNLNKKDLTRAVKETAWIKKTYTRRGGRVGYLEGFQMPFKGRLSGIFGSRRILNGEPRKPHGGIDLAARRGTPIRTTAPGTVAMAGRGEFFFTGNTVVVDHGDGVISLYSHMHKVRVKEGDWLPRGAIIGTVGSTGRATGPHLHWGITVRGDRVDPLRMPGMNKN